MASGTLNPEAAEFTPVSASPPPRIFPTVFPPLPPPCCVPLLPCVEGHPPSVPFLELCSPQFSVYNNSLNVYYAAGFLWPGPDPDPLLKNPYPDPSWHHCCSSLAAAPAAQGSLPNSLLPQPPRGDDQKSAVGGQEITREGEAEEVVASFRSTAIGHRAAAGRKITRSAAPSHSRKIPEQRKGMPSWRPRRRSGQSCTLDQQVEEEPKKHTTLMIRNIPNKFTRKMLLEDLDEQCLEQNEKSSREADDFLAYDFVYLPIDFRTGCNRGYAFVNLTSASGACKLRAAYRGRKWNTFGSKKTCDIFYANIQGKAALEEHFKRSSFLCDSDDFLPIAFDPSRNGSSVFVASNVGKRVPPA